MKKFYKENRVFVILMGIALVCIAIIVAMLAGYVLKSTTGDVYGNRLDGISDVVIEEETRDDMIKKISDMDKVEEADILIHGKIINFIINFEKETTVAEAQSTAVLCLELFEEDHLNYYDLQFSMTRSEEEETSESDEKDITFPMLGYRKAQASTISWSNNSKK